LGLRHHRGGRGLGQNRNGQAKVSAMNDNAGRSGIHPEVKQVDVGPLCCYYVISQREQDRFRSQATKHEQRVLDEGAAAGYTTPKLSIQTTDRVSWLEFRGGLDGIQIYLRADRVVHPEYGLEIDRIAAVVDELIVKMVAASRDRRSRTALKLYWLTDPHREDDWFVVARSARDARRFYLYDVGEDASAAYAYSCERILTLPKNLQKVDDEVFNIHDDHDSGWPTHELLRSCGAVFLREDSARVVQIGGRQFAEGMLDEEVERARRGDFGGERN
jgi:hypothetical protein